MMNVGDLLEANVRIAGMWPIPSPQAHDELINAVELDMPDELLALAESFGWDEGEIDELADGERYAWDALFDQMINSGKSGWIIKADTPAYNDDPTQGPLFYSWGHYYHAVFFVADVAEGLQKAVDWADKNYEDAKAAHASAKAAA
jgi:hypothetical protein